MWLLGIFIIIHKQMSAGSIGVWLQDRTVVLVKLLIQRILYFLLIFPYLKQHLVLSESISTDEKFYILISDLIALKMKESE